MHIDNTDQQATPTVVTPAAARATGSTSVRPRPMTADEHRAAGHVLSEEGEWIIEEDISTDVDMPQVFEGEFVGRLAREGWGGVRIRGRGDRRRRAGGGR